MHFVDPDEGAYIPLGHFLHTLLEFAARSFANVPESHGVQTVWASLFAYVPSLHGLHALCVPLLENPGVHGKQLKKPGIVKPK